MSRFSIYAKALREALVARQIPVEGGPMDGVLIITNRDLIEAFEGTPIPPADEHNAELVEPAEVALWAECHHCHENVPTMVRLESYSKARANGTIVGHIAIGNPVTHTCGQLQMKMAGEAPGQTEADWTIMDITGIEQHTCECPQRFVGEGEERVGPLCVPHGWAGDRTAPEEQQDWTACVEHGHVSTDAGPVPEEDGAGAPMTTDDFPILSGNEADDPVILTIEECPYAGCILAAEHIGRHVDAHGKPIGRSPHKPKATAPEGDVPDVPSAFADAFEDDALLPGEDPDK